MSSRRPRFFWSLALFAAASGGALLGCGERKEAPPAEASSAAAPPPPSPGEPPRPRAALAVRPAPQPLASPGGKPRAVTAEACEAPGPPPLGPDAERVLRAVELLDDRLFVADAEGRTRVFRVEKGEGCKLSELPVEAQPEAPALAGEVTWLSRDERGSLLVSKGPSLSVLVRKGEPPVRCEGPGQGELSLSPDGKTALAPQPGGKLSAVSFTRSGCSIAPWPVDMHAGLSRISSVGFHRGSTFIAGKQTWEVLAKAPTVMLALASARGDVKGGFETSSSGRLQPGVEPTSFGEIRGIRSCGPRLCVLDDGLSRLSLRDPRGELLELVDLRALLGLSSLRAQAVTYAADHTGYLLVVAPAPEGGSVGGIVRIRGL